MRMREVEPRLPLVALTNGDFLQVGQPGASPWLGGIDIDDFGGGLVAAADSFGADAISPVHGYPQNGKVGDPGYVPYTTPAMVAEAHARGIDGRPVDGRRPGDDAHADRRRRRRPHHRLPRPAARGAWPRAGSSSRAGTARRAAATAWRGPRGSRRYSGSGSVVDGSPSAAATSCGIASSIRYGRLSGLA